MEDLFKYVRGEEEEVEEDIEIEWDHKWDRIPDLRYFVIMYYLY